MRIFKDLELVEQLGSGIPRILDHYGKESFNFSENFLRMAFVTKELTTKVDDKEDNGEGGAIGGVIGGVIGSEIDDNSKLTKRQKEVLKLIAENKTITYNEIAEVLGINESAVGKHINAIKEKGYLERKDGTRGYWEINMSK